MLPAPLAGVRVLDLSQVISGPICGRVLADLGADVVKVESPVGDISRRVPPHVAPDTGLYFSQANAGKRAVCVDLRTDAGAELVRRLVACCDVLLENFRPGVLTRRALGPDELLAAHPRLVYCSISGWGQDGPWAQRRAYAPLVHAEAGRIELAARLRGTPPQQEVHVHGDVYPGLVAASAILGALFQRERTGQGQHLDVSMAEVLVYADEWSSSDLAGVGREREFDIWTHPVLELGDGTAVTLVGSPARLFAQWTEALGRPDLTQPDDDDAGLEVIASLLAQVPDFATLEQRLDGYPMLVAEVRSVAELAATDWAAQRGVFTEVEPGARVVTAPYRSEHAPIGVQGRAPRHGEHTRAVLAELLGLGDDEIDALVQSGAVVAR